MRKAVRSKDKLNIRVFAVLGGVATFVVILLFGVFLGYRGCVITSGSMEPFLSVDDYVLTYKIDSVNVGDVVLYKDDDNSFVHRVILIDGDEIITQGDANDIADEPVDISGVEGRMIARIPYLGAVVRTLCIPVDFVAARFRSGMEAIEDARASSWIVEVKTDTEGEIVIGTTDTTKPENYKFTVSNTRDGATCEVSFTYKVVVEIPKVISGLGVKLKCGDESIEGTCADGKVYTFTSEKFTFDANNAETQELILDFSGEDVTLRTALYGIKVNVIAEQAT